MLAGRPLAQRRDLRFRWLLEFCCRCRGLMTAPAPHRRRERSTASAKPKRPAISDAMPCFAICLLSLASACDATSDYRTPSSERKQRIVRAMSTGQDVNAALTLRLRGGELASACDATSDYRTPSSERASRIYRCSRIDRRSETISRVKTADFSVVNRT